ncbi:MAG: ABC transporter substrate-binding protein [Rhodospirillales bacterium]|nr:ABC transporter substrate-binding protein [Rhodospirillales bacterium]
MPRLPMSISRRRLLVAFVLPLIVGGGAALRSAAADSSIADGAQALVQAFADEGVLLLRDEKASPAASAERFRTLLDRYFATDVIARWVLGRYWNQFNPQERDQYRQLFEDLVVYGYVKRFGDYAGEQLRIVRTLTDSPTQATVFTEIDRPASGQSVRVDWRVGGRDGVFRITDVVVENVSLSQTWRSDFSAVIQQGGGPSGLLTTLRERTGQLKAELGIAN